MISLSPPPAAAAFTPRRTFSRRRLTVAGTQDPTSPSSSDQSPPRAVIIGAGLAGLAAATRLHSSNIPFLLLDSAAAVGGRVQTDLLDGFLLDRGFQILITAYPEAQSLLDYPALDLRNFYSGALIFAGRRQFHRLADPLRHPLDSLSSLLNPVGSPADKFLVGLSRLRAASLSDAALLSAPESSILSRLRAAGFSPSMIDQFFRPFFGGIFFDRELETSSRLFDFIFKCLALGANALPSKGIAAIPEQLAAKLPRESIKLNTAAAAVDSSPAAVRVAGGNTIAAELGVILAVDLPSAVKLLPWCDSLQKTPALHRPPRSTVCLYFSADRAPLSDPILLLNGTGKGLVNNMFFASNVVPAYAPEGKTLVSVSLIGDSPLEDDDLAKEVVRELEDWFGDSEVQQWRHLRTYRIPFAQPDQSPPTEFVSKDFRAREGVYLCGDYMSSATFDGALVSGRLAAEALIRDRFPS